MFLFQIKCCFAKSPAYFESLSSPPHVPHYRGDLVRGQECGYAIMGCGQSFTESLKVTSQHSALRRDLSAAQPDAPGLFSCPFEILNGSTQCRLKYQSPQPHIHKICEHGVRVNLSSNYFLKHSYVLTFWKLMIWETPSSPNLGEGKTCRWSFSLLWEKAAVSVPTRRFPRQITKTAEFTSLCLHLCFPLMFRILKTGRAGDEWLPCESD